MGNSFLGEKDHVTGGREWISEHVSYCHGHVWTLGLRVCDDASLSELGGMHMVLKKVNSKMKKVSGSAAQTCFFFFYLYLGF